MITATGVAGFVSGTAAVAVPGASVGGKLLLRVNTTGGAVDQSVTVGGRDLPIQFSTTEGNVFDVSFSSLVVNIADVLWLQGSLSYSSATINTVTYQTVAATDLVIFVGDGPPLLANGDPNPFVHGIRIRNATVGLITDGTSYALDAQGIVETVGLPEYLSMLSSNTCMLPACPEQVVFVGSNMPRLKLTS